MKRVRVIKLGGSLLTLPNLREKFHRWCRDHPHSLTLIIVGGGEVVEAVRVVDAANRLPEDFAHWICIDLMQYTARIAHGILGNVEIYETRDELQQILTDSTQNSMAPATAPTIAIVQIATCFQPGFSNLGLPENWDVTSDTLAAAFGILYAAEELVVMKSADPPCYDKLEDLAEVGFVDPCFAEIAEGIGQVRFVNLRAY
ncbi:MAG: hypothetical protein R3C53_26995 [Pirellulaceae bacterium]